MRMTPTGIGNPLERGVNMNNSYPKWFLSIDHALMKIYRAIAFIAAFALLAIVLIAFVDVCGEKLAKAGLPVSGVPNYSNWIAYLHVVVVFMTCGYVTLERGHTVVDILTNHLPKVLQRVVGFISLLLGVVVSSFLTYRGVVGLLADSLRYNTTITTTSTFPQWPFVLVYIAGCGLLCISFIWAAIRYCYGYRPALPGEGSENEEVAK